MYALGGGGGGGVNTSNAAFNIRDKKNYIFIDISEIKHLSFTYDNLCNTNII